LTGKGPNAVLMAVQRIFLKIPLEELSGALIVVDDWRTRIRRPPG